MKFLRCSHCGQIIAIVKETGVPVICCGEAMQEIIPKTADLAFEKHVPAAELKDGKLFVRVGEVAHPMAEEHYIEWIALETNLGNQRKALNPGDVPEAVFALLEGEEVQGVYAYCNIHSLWKK